MQFSPQCHMEDIAQSIMEQIRMDDGVGPHLLVATWKEHRSNTWSHIIVLPITKDGTLSYNVQTMRWTVYGEVDEYHLNPDHKWRPSEVCNFADSEDVAQFLMYSAKARHNPQVDDRPTLALTVGPLGTNLFNQQPMLCSSQAGVKGIIDLLPKMRATVTM